MTRAKKPSWMTNLVPHFIGPHTPITGDFPRHEVAASLALWPEESLRLAARHALVLDFRRLCAAELERRAS